MVSLEQGALPYGISVSGNKLYIADSRDKGGLIQFDLSNGNSNVVVENLSTECQRIHSVAVTTGGDVVFTDRDAKKIKKFCNGTVTEIAGSGSDLSKTGLLSQHLFSSRPLFVLKETPCMFAILLLVEYA